MDSDHEKSGKGGDSNNQRLSSDPMVLPAAGRRGVHMHNKW